MPQRHFFPFLFFWNQLVRATDNIPSMLASPTLIYQTIVRLHISSHVYIAVNRKKDQKLSKQALSSPIQMVPLVSWKIFPFPSNAPICRPKNKPTEVREEHTFAHNSPSTPHHPNNFQTERIDVESAMRSSTNQSPPHEIYAAFQASRVSCMNQLFGRITTFLCAVVKVGTLRHYMLVHELLAPKKPVDCCFRLPFRYLSQ